MSNTITLEITEEEAGVIRLCLDTVLTMHEKGLINPNNFTSEQRIGWMFVEAAMKGMRQKVDEALQKAEDGESIR